MRVESKEREWRAGARVKKDSAERRKRVVSEERERVEGAVGNSKGRANKIESEAL